MISIVMPVYNGERFLEESVQSVLNQSFKNFELIIVDDGSTDSTGSIIDVLSKEDNRIIGISQENKGAAKARNVGIDFCSGDYILFLDSDDLLTENALKDLYEKAVKHDADLVIGNYQYLYEENKRIVHSSKSLEDNVYCNGEITECLHLKCIPPNKLLKKDLLKENDIYFPLLCLGEDLCFYHMCLVNCKKVVTISSTVVTYRIYDGSCYKSYGTKTKDYIRSFHLIEEYYKKNGYSDIFNEVLYDKIKYFVKASRKLPRHENKKERVEILNAFIKEWNNTENSGLEFSSQTVEMCKKFNRIKKYRWLYTAELPTKIYRVFWKVKNVVT